VQALIESLRKCVVRETKSAYPFVVPRERVEREVLECPTLELTDSTWKTLRHSNVLKDAPRNSIEAPGGMVRSNI
jgi:hypothetical protein